LWVRDTGIGIAPEHRARVFEPFTQIDSGLSRNFDGVGLGLSIALHLARAHGGELEIDGAPRRGTTVRFTLPRWRVSKTQRMVA
jgi:signal transduction histidine kinase